MTTLLRALGWGLLKGLALCLGIAIVVGAAHLSGALDPPPIPDTPQAPSRVETLIEQHGCWTGEAPEDTIPGTAIVTLPGRGAERLPADVGFRIWQGERDGELHAFCP